MDAAAIALITSLIQIAIKYAPELIEQGQLAIKLLTSGLDPTEAEKAQINAALEEAHLALQKAADEQLAKAKELGIE